MQPSERRKRADAIRFLSMDAVQKANSGHPGMPMGMADIAELLWHDFLNHSPTHPNWPNRDRFVLSNGHGSMLLYSLLHLTGYDLTIEDLKQFRQLHSKTPGHPEVGETPGVETTTGPLGQGLANAVGMAIAEKHLASIFNRPNYPLIDHYTYCFTGDGCLMEGISHEACSLAGGLGLGKLIVFYDDNGISIDGDVRGWFNDNTPLRFEAYGWHVIPKVDGHNSDAIHQAILDARAEKDRPTLICCQTTIGWGAVNLAGTAKTHGAALGNEEIAATRKSLGWSHPPFIIPEELYASWDAKAKGQSLVQDWQALMTQYAEAFPDLAAEFKRRMMGKLPQNWHETLAQKLEVLRQSQQSISTRKASQICLDHFAPLLSELMGGSADLTESNCTNWQDMTIFSKAHPEGRYIHYGVREFGMSAIMNGLALSGGIIPFGGTFLTFSDYARNAIRLAALMKLREVFIYSHDSIGLGEDGPTHQPIEHISSLRLIPNLSVWRPCDLSETFVAWQVALEHNGPTCLMLSRQNVKAIERTSEQLAKIAHGGYVLFDNGQVPNAVLIATGSEVELALEAAQTLAEEGLAIRVVSMPSTNVFLSQSQAYQEDVLPLHIPRVAIEAGSTDYWYRFVGLSGGVIGIDQFGASAPAKEIYAALGVTVSRIITVTKSLLQTNSKSAQQIKTKYA